MFLLAVPMRSSLIIFFGYSVMNVFTYRKYKFFFLESLLIVKLEFVYYLLGEIVYIILCPFCYSGE